MATVIWLEGEEQIRRQSSAKVFYLPQFEQSHEAEPTTRAEKREAPSLIG